MRMQLQTEIQELRGRGVAREGGGCKEEDLGREEGKTGEGGDKGEGWEGKRQGSGGENWETGVALLQTDLTKVSSLYKLCLPFFLFLSTSHEYWHLCMCMYVYVMQCEQKLAAEKELAVEVVLVHKEVY